MPILKSNSHNNHYSPQFLQWMNLRQRSCREELQNFLAPKDLSGMTMLLVEVDLEQWFGGITKWYIKMVANIETNI